MATIFYCNNSELPARLNAVRAGKGFLKEDKYKQIIIDALKFLVVENKISLNGFVIMENHVRWGGGLDQRGRRDTNGGGGIPTEAETLRLTLRIVG